jgi:hypothetical protein
VDHIIHHKFKNFPKGIPVKAGERFVIEHWVIGCERMYYSETGADFLNHPNEDKGLFTVEKSELSENSTSVNRGIIPGIIYALA